MNSAPLILIAPSTQKAGEEFYDYAVSLSDAYSRAVIEAGGIPMITPCAPGGKLVAEMVSRADGVLLSGGDDIQPKLYWEDVPEDLAKTSKDHDPQRDLFEMVLINETFRQRKPMLAICRGHQMVNVALGGTLVVDLPSQAPSEIRHARMDLKDKVVHPIQIEEGSMLRAILGKSEIGVNSTHHQAIDKVAPGLKVSARAADGVIEATELCKPILPYYLGVQFHPERLIWRQTEFQELFRSFSAACALHRNRQL
jgi:putative glutamine amidotransferase